MKRVFTLLVAGLLMGAITGSAVAWEFGLTGEMETRYRYFSRTGGADLFGVANPAAAGFNDGAIGLSGYYGGTNQVVAQGFSAKGADAAINDYRIWLYPEIRVNSAILLRGEYWVTGGNPKGSYDAAGGGPTGGDSWFINRGEQGWYINPGPTGKLGMSTGMWEKFWATIQTPWGTVVLGRRGLGFGLGWSTLDQKDTDSEMVALVVPYGPFNFLFMNQLYENNWICPNQAQQLAPAASGGFNPAAVAAPTDKNGIRDINGAAALTYKSGCLDMGTASRYVFYRNIHNYSAASPGVAPVPAGPNQRDDASNSVVPSFFSGTGLGGLPTYSDVDIWQQLYYLKYANGRVFCNAEYAMNVVDVFRKGGRPLSGWQDAWMVELGVTSGPARLSLANFYKSGHDRRGGLLNTTSATGSVAGTFVMDTFNEFMIFGGSNDPIQPYNFLIGTYGAGNNGFDGRGVAWFNDFLAYAGRLDYAVASNLNVFGSFIYANRASNTSTAIGQYRGGVSNATYRTNPGFSNTGAQTGRVPNVPDNYLGWEADAGVDWKLLEGLTFHALFAYWQPGDWFKWAYVDYTDSSVTTVGGANYPVNPSRGIDPLIGFQGSMVIDF
jgi:hypothetical protein